MGSIADLARDLVQAPQGERILAPVGGAWRRQGSTFIGSISFLNFEASLQHEGLKRTKTRRRATQLGVINVLREAGPLAFLNLAAGGLGVVLAVVTLVLVATKSKAASVAGVLCLLVALGVLCLGVFGYLMGMAGTNASLGNVPDDMKDLLLRKGTQESRANFLIALPCAGFPLLAGAVAVIVRRLAAGIALALVATAGCVSMLVAFTRPLPPEGPTVVPVPGLELSPSSSSRPLGAWALIALTPDGLWVDGARVPSLATALGHPDVRERNLRRLPLLVDRRVQFGQLADVLHAASISGRREVELVVRAPDGAPRIVTLHDAPHEQAARPLLLTLSITDGALKIGAAGGTLDPLPRDWRALNEKLTEIKASFPGERTLRLTATPQTSVEDLVAAIDAAREHQDTTLFDEVVVGRFTLPEDDPRIANDDDASGSPSRSRGKVADAAPEVESADIDRYKLNAFLRGRIRAIQGCYEKELKQNPNLKGKVVVRFSITTGGRASEIEIEQDTMGNDAVGSCIKTVIRGWVFPFKPDSDVSVAYPFVFSPAMEPPEARSRSE